MSTDSRPLAGKAVVVTRPVHQAGPMVASLRELGADPVEIPAIRIQPRSDLSPLETALRDLRSYHWLVFTSVNGVRITLDRYQEMGLAPEPLAALQLAAIGPATAGALRDRGLEADFVPESYIAEEVAAGLPLLAADRVLLPRAEGARPVLPTNLEARGAIVDEIPIYQSVPAEIGAQAQAHLRAGVDTITFTSPSTAQSFGGAARRAGLDPTKLTGDPLVACIGPITAEACTQIGYRVSVVAEDYTAEGLVAALIQHYREERARGHR